MSRHRFFLTGPLAGGSEMQVLPLSAADARHAAKALRVRAGEAIEVVEPGGGVSVAVVSGVAGGRLSAEVVGMAEDVAKAAPAPCVTLFQGLAKGDKMDAVVRQAVEVGARGIVPVLMGRSVVKLDARQCGERGERWRRVAEAAAKQAHRDRVPAVCDPVRFSALPELLGAYDRVVVLWEEADAEGLAESLGGLPSAGGSEVALVVGPEGGLAAEEVRALQDLGARVATLGPTVLRTETAAVVALALAIHTLGGLGSAR